MLIFIPTRNGMDMDTQTDTRRHGRTDTQTHGQTNTRTHELTDSRTHGHMDTWTHSDILYCLMNFTF